MGFKMGERCAVRIPGDLYDWVMQKGGPDWALSVFKDSGIKDIAPVGLSGRAKALFRKMRKAEDEDENHETEPAHLPGRNEALKALAQLDDCG